MCESTAYILKGDKEELLMSDVAKITPMGDQVELVTIMGEKIIVDGKIKEVNTLRHKIIILAK